MKCRESEQIQELKIDNMTEKKQKTEQNMQHAQKQYTKEQILHAKKYENRKDLLNALLKDGELYTMQQAEKSIEDFMKGQVN